MAILEPTDGWAIDQALAPMLADLGLSSLAPKEAALRLAHQRAQRILETSEDPLPSLPYFYQLMLAADCPEELQELGYLDDVFFGDDADTQRALAHEALENLLSPELRERTRAEKKAARTSKSRVRVPHS
jgi:hypothetical protein